MARTVLVTGALGTLGAIVVDRLATAGWRVFAADLPGEPLDRLAGRAMPLPMDVTDPDSVRAAATAIAEVTDRLDGVVHATSLIRVGPLIEIPVEEVERMLAVHVLGVLRLNQAVFPLLLAARGRIVTVGSDTGTLPPDPFNGSYSMAKHALEAYAHGLRRELEVHGVDVVMVRPGPFGRGAGRRMGDAYREAAERSTHYVEALRAMGAQRRATGTAHALTASTDVPDTRTARVAAVVEEALTAASPRCVYTVGTRRKRALLEALPFGVADRYYRRRLSAR